MVTRVNGGVFDDQMVTGHMRHFVIEGADFSGAVDQYGQPVPGSAADIIFNNISQEGFIDIMNPNQYNISFALEIERSNWDGPSLTQMVQSLGTNVGVDHINCAVCVVTEVPYIWDLGSGGVTQFIQLSDVPNTYVGSANYVVQVNPSATGLIFVPYTPDAFSYIAVPSQPTITAGVSDILTFIPGANITITTNASLKTVTINSTAGTDYIPVPSGTTLSFSLRYFVTGPFPTSPSPLAFVTLPLGTGSGKPAGTSVIITKPADNLGQVSLLINTQGSDIINTDLGTTNSVEFDATQEVIFVFDGVHTWNLQIGSVNI